MADNGVGLDPIIASNPFAAYRYGEQFGTGLYLAQKIMQLCGGQVTYHPNETGEMATVFCVQVPNMIVAEAASHEGP